MRLFKSVSMGLYILLSLKKSLDSIHMGRISSPLAEFAKVLCTNRVLITARAVRTKRVSLILSIHIKLILFGIDLDNIEKGVAFINSIVVKSFLFLRQNRICSSLKIYIAFFCFLML